MLLCLYEINGSLGDPWFFDDRGDGPKGGPGGSFDMVRKEGGGSISAGMLFVYYMCERFGVGMS